MQHPSRSSPVPPPPLSLAVDRERILASLAIAHNNDAEAEATAGAEAGTAVTDAAASGSAASSALPLSDRSLSESRSNSSLYAQHVLHQIALAATPRHRHKQAQQRQQLQQQQQQLSVAESASLAAGLPTSPNGLDFAFELNESDLQFDVTLEGEEEEARDDEQDRHTADSSDVSSVSLPLAHLNPAQQATSAAEMLRMVGAEVQREEDREGLPTSGMHRAAARTSHVPFAVSVTQPAGSSLQNSLAPEASPQYLLSPATQAEFAEVQQWSSHFDVQLSPTPQQEGAHNMGHEEAQRQQAVAESDRALLHRARIIDELLSSERSYLRALDALVHFYLQPLRADLTASLPTSVQVSAEHQATLFGQVEIIAQLSRRLYADLEAAVATPTPHHNAESGGVSNVVPAVGEIMLRFSPFFKMYTGYVANHEQSSALLRTLEKNKEFASWCTRQRALSGSSLQSLLIAPVQRVPRYSLLLQELLRRTCPSHPDFASLTRALSLVNHAASHINESVRAAENRAHILALQDRFNNAVVLLTPTRWFVRQSPLTKQGRHSDVEYEFLLFSDLLLYASRSSLGGSLKLHHSIPLDHSFQFASLPDQTEEEGMHAPQHATPLTRDNSTPTSSTATDLETAAEQRNPSISPSPALSPLPPSTPQLVSVVSPSSLTLAVPSRSPASGSASVTFPSRLHHRILIESSHRSFVVYARSALLKREWLSDLQAVTMQIRLQENQRKENVAMAKAAGGHHSTRSTDSSDASRTHQRMHSTSGMYDSSAAEAAAAVSASVSAVSVSPLPSFGRLQPVMERYKSSSACFVCHKLCTSFSGRRHCQSCGRVCCSRCCRSELLLEWSRKESKCCDTCVDKLKRIKERLMDEAAASSASSASSVVVASISSSAVAPPVPLSSRPALPLRPRRPSRPSDGAISMLIESAHSRQASADADTRQHNNSTRHTNKPLHADTAAANSDEEPEDSAGILSPKAICA